MVQASSDSASRPQRNRVILPITEMAVLHIRMFGELDIRYGDEPVTGLHSSRLRSLLAWLLLQAGSTVQRRRLAFTMWPDSTETQAHANLRNLIFRLRQTLPEIDTFAVLDGPSLRWKTDAPFTLDLAEFEAIVGGPLTQASVARGVELYRGDLMPECYDEWITPER